NTITRLLKENDGLRIKIEELERGLTNSNSSTPQIFTQDTIHEIKYRAWYKGDIDGQTYDCQGEARMSYDIQDTYDGSGFIDELDGFGWVSNFNDFIEDDDFVVMQYTNLRDKDGVEIYEGDIGWDEHLECYGVVKFQEGKFTYDWDNISE